MELKQDARVVNAAGDGVGHIDRVVLNPKTKEVTAIVVRKGVLFTQDKVVPIDMVDATREGEVMLRADAGNLDDLQEYKATYYVSANEEDLGAVANDSDRRTFVEPVYAYPPFGSLWAGGAYAGTAEPTLVRKTQTNIAENEVALKKGVRVLASNGDHIGDIDEVLTDPGSRRASHFVLTQGLLFKTRKLIPMDWVRVVTDDRVELVVGPRAFEQLRDYDESRESGPEVPII